VTEIANACGSGAGVKAREMTESDGNYVRFELKIQSQLIF
jgi:hypothetical protein